MVKDNFSYVLNQRSPSTNIYTPFSYKPGELIRGGSGEGVLGVKRFRGSGEVKSNIHALAGI